MEIIMKDLLPKYNLIYEKVVNNDIYLQNCIKSGIKCICTFDLMEFEWDNFNDYYNDISIKQDEKLLTLEILEKQNDKFIENHYNFQGHAAILSDIDNDGNYILLNSWGKEWANKGTFKTKKECLKNRVFFPIYYWEYNLTQEEKNSWIKLFNDIKKYLNEMKYIRCPVCKRTARINQFERMESFKIKCPYEEKCIFEINNNENDVMEFIAEQLLSYDLYTNMNAKKKFDFGFR